MTEKQLIQNHEETNETPTRRKRGRKPGSGKSNSNHQPTEIGIRIRKWREKRGYSLDTLQKRSSVSKTYIYYLENGTKNNATVSVLEKISKGLDIPLLYLIQEHDIEEKAENL